MLPKKKRLTKKQFDQFFKTGKRVHTKDAQLMYAPHDTFHGAVVVGKKVYKRAVDRNKLRRQIYHVLYALHKTEQKTGIFIVIAKPSLKEKSFQDVRSTVQELLARL